MERSSASFRSGRFRAPTRSATNAGLMPSMAFVKHNDESRNAFPTGMVSVAGFGVDYSQDSTFSLAARFSRPSRRPAWASARSIELRMMKVPVGISRMLTDPLSMGGPVVPALSMLREAPAPFSTPLNTDGGLSARYMSASSTAKAFGVGADLGLHYQLSRELAVGAAYHSPIRFGTFHWNAADAGNNVHRLGFRMDMPLVVSMGTGYSHVDGTLLAVDARWINYANTGGFSESGFDPDGSVAGFGWRNTWTAPAIVRRHITAGITRMLSPKQAVHLVF